jgi:hypothetical protein
MAAICRLSRAARKLSPRGRVDGRSATAYWQAKAEEWLKKTSAPLIDELDKMPWRTGRLW